MIDLEKEREAFKKWAEKSADKASSVHSWIACAVSKQSEIDELKAQLAEAHKIRGDFVEYCRKIESGDFVLVKKEDSENWYLDEDEYIWYEEDSINGYLEDIDNGEVLEVQHTEYVVINSNPVFATNVFTDSDNITWELFDNRDDAEKAAAHCKAMIEAQEQSHD